MRKFIAIVMVCLCLCSCRVLFGKSDSGIGVMNSQNDLSVDDAKE